MKSVLRDKFCFMTFLLPILIAAALNFMGCTFNAMNIISEKEDGVAFVNDVLPMTPSQYVLPLGRPVFLFPFYILGVDFFTAYP